MESLSLEILLDIVSHLSLHEKASLCKTSRSLNQIITPQLYTSWDYHGFSHSFKSLHCFLRTVIEQPRLAFLVKTLDLQGWGAYPRPVVSSDEGEIDESDSSGDDDVAFGNGLDLVSEADQYGSADEISDNGKEVVSRMSSAEPKVENEISDKDYDRDFHIILRSITAITCNEIEANEVAQRVRDKDEDVILALIISLLPNLRDLYMVMPEETWAIQNLARSITETKTSIMANLESIYVSCAPCVGPKGHQTYFVDLSSVRPFFGLPKLHTLKILEPETNLYTTSRSHYTQTLLKSPPSNITSLSFEDGELTPQEVVQTLNSIKALRSFRWTQIFSCVSIASCKAPFYHLLRDGLLAHSETLETLDLCLIRFFVCRLEGHAYNPGAAGDTLIARFQEPRMREKNRHLIGSLTKFTTLKKLSLRAEALCGDSDWGMAPYNLHDALPKSLEQLSLYINPEIVEPRSSDTSVSTLESSPTNLQWINPVVELIRNVGTNDLSLKTLELHLEMETLPSGSGQESFFLRPLLEACENARVEFKIRRRVYEQDNLVREPYFKEVFRARGCIHV